MDKKEEDYEFNKLRDELTFNVAKALRNICESRETCGWCPFHVAPLNHGTICLLSEKAPGYWDAELDMAEEKMIKKYGEDWDD